jgi:hypothetical protein
MGGMVFGRETGRINAKESGKERSGSKDSSSVPEHDSCSSSAVPAAGPAQPQPWIVQGIYDPRRNESSNPWRLHPQPVDEMERSADFVRQHKSPSLFLRDSAANVAQKA